jgi:hypothetical protein
MRAMDSRHDFTLEKVFWGYFGALDQKANSALVLLHAAQILVRSPEVGELEIALSFALLRMSWDR